jgi:hypothetical protein
MDAEKTKRITIGDMVRLVAIPPNLPTGDARLDTPAIFQKCLGHQFVVTGFNEIGWAEIEVAPVTGSTGETIWVEPEFLELADLRSHAGTSTG